MDEDAQVYSKGDWVVHRYYGVGQVIGIEKKHINQKVIRFYKVRTKDSTFWLPVEDPINSRVDPLPSRKMVKRALKVLQGPAREMSKDTKERQQRIKSVQSEGSLLASAKLIRDLIARQSEARLNATEEQALKRLSNRMLKAWSIRMGIEVDEARRRLFHWVSGDGGEATKQGQPSKPKEKTKLPLRWRPQTKVGR